MFMQTRVLAGDDAEELELNGVLRPVLRQPLIYRISRIFASREQAEIPHLAAPVHSINQRCPPPWSLQYRENKQTTDTHEEVINFH